MKTKERVAKMWKYDSADHHHVCAMHEAGHAIAHVLSIGEMGYDISKAIHSIEMKMASDWSVAQGMPQATTYAHTFSCEIQVAAAHFVKACVQDHGELRLQDYPTVIKLARVQERILRSGSVLVHLRPYQALSPRHYFLDSRFMTFGKASNAKETKKTFCSMQQLQICLPKSLMPP